MEIIVGSAITDKENTINMGHLYCKHRTGSNRLLSLVHKSMKAIVKES